MRMDGVAAHDSVAEEPRQLGIADLLEHDPRPAFITELRTTSSDKIEIVFLNASLRSNTTLGDQIKGNVEGAEGQKAWSRFRDWAMHAAEHGVTGQDAQPTLAFRRILWSRISLQNKWRVVSANEGDPWSNKSTHIGTQHLPMETASASQAKTDLPLLKISNLSRVISTPHPLTESGSDWSLPQFAPDSSGYIDFIRGVDWASTALGPMEKWPKKLLEMCEFIVRDSRPASMYWGPKFVLIYNEAYASVIGSKHPELMGKTIVDAWPESCDALIATMETSRDIGRSSVDEEYQLFLERLEGRPEEVYFSWSVLPLFDGTECVGYINPVFETTKLRVGQRRIAMLNDLGEALAKASDVSSYWCRIMEGLELWNAYDVPFAMLYTATELSTSDISSGTGGPQSSSDARIFQLEGTIGVPEGHQSTPQCIDLARHDAGLMACFRQAIQSSTPVVLRTAGGDLPEDLFEGFEWRGFGDACTHVAVCSLRPTKDENVMGLLMIGLNPRRPYDDDYRQFISLLHQKLTSSLASSVLFEEEVRRGRNAAEQAAFDRAWLSEQLERRTKEVTDVTRRFQAVGEVVPVGLCFTNPEGHLTYANNTWYEITGTTKGIGPTISFIGCVADEDAQMVRDCWLQLISTGIRTNFEFRIKPKVEHGADVSTDRSTPSRSETRSRSDVDHPDGSIADDALGAPNSHAFKWALATVSPGCAEDGTAEMITISLTDITVHKQTAEEALLRAQQAERASELLARFKRMADYATVGLFDLRPNGKIVQANDTFYQIMGLTKPNIDFNPSQCWLDAILDEDLPVVRKNQEILRTHGKPIADEIRLKKPWVDEDATGHPSVGQTWILATTLPVRDSEGNIIRLTGCVTDISAQKAKAHIALERADLLDQLLIRTREAKSSEEKFARFAEAAPIGISIMTADGCVNYCNDTWFKVMHHPSSTPLDQPFLWTCQVEEDDLHIVQAALQSIMSHHDSPTIEFRIKHLWNAPGNSAESAPPAPTWLMSSFFPEIDESGNVKSIMSCLSDISHFKWAESIQKQRTIEALESKRQQENFIDMTSHEMRNPLSAIVQCADLIVDALEDIRISSTESVQLVIDGSLEAAQTIISCAQHQKAIVDDILTLSKMDSDLLSITPVAADPQRVLGEAVKIFAAESRRAGIKLSVAVDKSVNELMINWVLLDTSRLLQVLINLLTNALKFTQTGAEREVTVTMSASTERPSRNGTSIFSYIPTRSARDDLLPVSSSYENDGQPFFLHFAVKDTGRGLTDAEKKLLFKRFSQASPRTHVQYGGSGLGLFISRELTELQGGEIGVASEPGVGSTFAFYIKTQKTSPPKDVIITPKTFGGAADRDASRLSIAVLIVEDNLINQAVLSKQLRNLGSTVYVANHGMEALDFLRTTKYWKSNEGHGIDLKVILLDIEMPVMDGLTCARKIRELQRELKIIGHVPIIAVSANARSEQIVTAKAAGIDDVVVKPFRIPELVPKIKTLIERLEAQNNSG